ncbi:mitochondrial coenzyme A diphosphatase NUDT8 [Anabrus simplex]|uniref:mitochondrial coenzyme A diphosphatase NUDT8 n=1 Tax=Anabrus simplex TaxID=316456 RepID=UPI0035A39B24
MKQWLWITRHSLNWERFCHSQVLSVENVLSKETREKCVAKLKAMPPLRVGNELPTRKAAVLVPLCIVDGAVSLLYTLRSSGLKSYRGHVSFPGGVKDEADESLEETALRETEEELGISKGYVDIWGHANFIGTAQQDMAVMPFVGCLGVINLEQLHLNQEEVAAAFTVPLKQLCDPVNQRYTHFRGKYSLPVFTGGEYKIWGVTAVITHIVLSSLIPDVYKNRLRMLKFSRTV